VRCGKKRACSRGGGASQRAGLAGKEKGDHSAVRIGQKKERHVSFYGEKAQDIEGAALGRGIEGKKLLVWGGRAP